jgi:hypothetical protein
LPHICGEYIFGRGGIVHFSTRTTGDNVMYKTESDQMKDKLIEQLIQSKEEVIAAKQAEIDVLKK